MARNYFPNSAENEWDIEVTEVEPGFYAIRQTFPGMDNNVIFNQIRTVVDRGNAIKKGDTVMVNGELVDAMIFRIEATDSKGTKQTLHLGEITKLGRMQRAGPGNIMLGSELSQAHGNFLYGLTTMLNMGYELGDTIAAFEELSVEKQGDLVPMHRRVAKGRGRKIGTDIQRIVELKKDLKDADKVSKTIIKRQIKEIQASINLRNTILDKIIYGRRITFGKSLASQKSLFALERMFKADYDGNLSEVARLLTEEQRADLAGMSLTEAAETLIEFLLYQEEILSPSFMAKEVKVKKVRLVANLSSGKLETKARTIKVLDVGTHTIEQTSTALVVRDKTKRKTVVAQLPLSILQEEATALAKDIIEARVDSEAVRKKSLRIQNRDVTTQTERTHNAFRRAEDEANAADEELLSIIISIYGLQTKAGAVAAAKTVNETSGDTNFMEPAGTAEPLFNDDGVRIDVNNTVLEDDTQGTEEFSEVDFQARVRSKFDEDASKEAPFKADNNSEHYCADHT